MNLYVVGTSGAGKSTLAKQLAQSFKLHYIELDAFQFEPHWVKRLDEDFENDILQETKKGPWVICGNYRNIQALLIDQVDHLIWLDYPFPLILWRVIKRTFRRLMKKEKCCGENYETWYQQFFTKYSIFVWVFGSHWKNRRRYRALLQDPRHTHRVQRFRSPKALEIYLENL